MDPTVLVVGAGPTGLLLAAELQRRGVTCRLIDANPAPLHWDRATVVHPRSLEVFESLGIVVPLLTSGVKQRFARVHSQGDVLGEIELSICGSRYGFNLGVSEEVTESILTDYLRQRGGEVVRASRLVDLKAGDSHVVATIEHDGATEEVAAQWIVGCDGLHSITRERSGITLAGHDIPEPWAVFDVTLSGWPLSYEAIYGYLDEPPVILTALPQKRWRVYLRPSGENSDLVAEASATVRRYYPSVRFDDVTNPTRFHCHTKVARQYRAGRVLIAGDAAHVCSPFQGHGMNTGIQDGFNLAWKLALVCQGHCTAAILDSYEAERRPVAEMIGASGDEVEHAQTLSDPTERRARDAALRALLSDPCSRHHEAIAEAELNVDYGKSPIVMGDPHEGIGPGQRLPDTITVRQSSGEQPGLHELAHRPGHTALLIGGPSSRDDDLAALADAIRARSDTPIVEACVVLTTRSPDGQEWASISPHSAEQLGVRGTSLLVVRPDGHIGLRADRNHVDAHERYLSLLKSGPSGSAGRRPT